jgi:hypothetical protein
MTKFPKSIFDILSGAISALPDNVSSFVRTAVNLFPSSSEALVEKAVHSSDNKYAQDIVDSAIKAGLDEESAINAAILGGATTEQLAKNNK